MSEEQNNIDQNGIQQTEGMDTQESQGGEGAENEDERCEKIRFHSNGKYPDSARTTVLKQS